MAFFSNSKLILRGKYRHQINGIPKVSFISDKSYMKGHVSDAQLNGFSNSEHSDLDALIHPGRGNAKCKRPEVGACLPFSRNSNKNSTVGTQ